MKITDIKTFLLKVSLGEKRFCSSQSKFPDRNSLLIRIETDNGLIGWGESGQYDPGEPFASFIENVLKPLLIRKKSIGYYCVVGTYVYNNSWLWT